MLSEAVAEMEGMCACLACSGGGERMADFYEKGWVVGHYDELASFDNDDYGGGGAYQLEAMKEKAEDSDQYLCSLRIAKKIDIPDDRAIEGKQLTSEQRKLGVIDANTTPMYVFEGDSGYETFPVGNEDKAKAEFEASSADYLYKAIPLTETKIVAGDEYQLNEYETPNTFSPWGSFSEQLQALYNRNDLPKLSPTSYTSDQTELLCEEYIRVVHPEFYPLIQTGGATGTREGLDIIGAENGTSIVGEVKNKNEIEEDVVKTLRNYSDRDAEAYYFIRGEGTAKDLNVVNIQTVLEELSNTHRDEMIERMTTY